MYHLKRGKGIGLPDPKWLQDEKRGVKVGPGDYMRSGEEAPEDRTPESEARVVRAVEVIGKSVTTRVPVKHGIDGLTREEKYEAHVRYVRKMREDRERRQTADYAERVRVADKNRKDQRRLLIEKRGRDVVARMYQNDAKPVEVGVGLWRRSVGGSFWFRDRSGDVRPLDICTGWVQLLLVCRRF